MGRLAFVDRVDVELSVRGTHRVSFVVAFERGPPATGAVWVEQMATALLPVKVRLKRLVERLGLSWHSEFDLHHIELNPNDSETAIEAMEDFQSTFYEPKIGEPTVRERAMGGELQLKNVPVRVFCSETKVVSKSEFCAESLRQDELTRILSASLYCGAKDFRGTRS